MIVIIMMIDGTVLFVGLEQDHKVMRQTISARNFEMMQTTNFNHGTELSAIYHYLIGIKKVTATKPQVRIDLPGKSST